MAKSRCPMCKRKMLVEGEENEQCTSDTCNYFVDYYAGDKCKHCGQDIRTTVVYGWYHGTLSGGWNTSCEDDQHRAEPISEESTK